MRKRSLLRRLFGRRWTIVPFASGAFKVNEDWHGWLDRDRRTWRTELFGGIFKDEADAEDMIVKRIWHLGYWIAADMRSKRHAVRTPSRQVPPFIKKTTARPASGGKVT